MNESAKRNTWLRLRDTLPWQETSSKECDVLGNLYFVFMHTSAIHC